MLGSAILTNATVSFHTKVEIENDLTDLTVDVGGVQTTVSAIDLEGVTVGGDAYFSYVAGGTTSTAQPTASSGSVNITIDSIYVHIPVLGISTTVAGFAYGGSPLAVTLTQGITNTVMFDQSTAANLLNSLAKRRAK